MRWQKYFFYVFFLINSSTDSVDIRFRFRSAAKQVKKVKDYGSKRQNESKRLAPYNLANRKPKGLLPNKWLPNSKF